MRKFASALLLGIVGLAGLASPARADILIDHFTSVAAPSPWPLSRSTPGTTSSTETGLAGVLGGTRRTDLTATVASAIGAVTANVDPTAPGTLTYNSVTGADGLITLTYDGGGGGLGDLTTGGNTGILIDFLNYDFPGSTGLPVTMTASDGMNTFSVMKTYNQLSPPAGSLTFDFASFTGVNFSTIASLSFEFNPVAASDFRIDRIAAVPEPSPALLGLLGISFAFATRKLRSLWS